MDNLTQGWTQLGPFLQNRGTFLNFKKRAGETSPSSPVPTPLPLVVRLLPASTSNAKSLVHEDNSRANLFGIN